MPLSEREQQLLAQLEQQLNAEDPGFATSMHHSPVRPAFSTRSIVLGAVLGLVGLGVVIAGVALGSVIVGVVGFLIMCGGVYWASLQQGRSRPAASAPHDDAARGSSGSSPFMRNLENRWNQRQGGDAP